MHEKDILEWKEEDRMFLETHNFQVMLDQVRCKPYVTFVGVPGSGKTATARHIALKLQKEGYEILPITDTNKIEDYCNVSSPQVFVIDDVLGVYGLMQFELHTINKYSKRLTNPFNPKTKILMTCRQAVFSYKKLSDSVLMKKENIVFLHSEENELTDEDKRNLLAQFNLGRNFLTSDQLASSSNMFPLLCKLYSCKKELQSYGANFFRIPVYCIIKHMNSLKIHNEIHYAALVLLMANKNRLSKKILDNEDEETIEIRKNEESFEDMRRSILIKCEKPAAHSYELINALKEMKGTYTKKRGREFTFFHDSLFEIIAYHFGCKNQELILKYARSNYIANHIKVDKENSRKRKREIDCEEDKAREKNDESETSIDLHITLHKEHYEKLAERLFKDLQNGEFYDVFGNEALKSPSILQYFIAIMEKKSYEDLYNLLLSVGEKSSKTCNWEYEQKEKGANDKQYMNMRTRGHGCLMSEIKIDGQWRSIVRGISWVIFFGHHQLLQRFLHILQENEKIDDLFLYTFNERLQPYSNTDQDITEEDNSLNHSMVVRSFKNPEQASEDPTDIDIDRETEHSPNSDTSGDGYLYGLFHFDIDSEASSDIDSDTDDLYDETDSDTSVYPNDDPVVNEQCRLLCLGCHSGDLTTVQILLEHVDSHVLNNCFENSYHDEHALIIACEYGYLDIAMKLLEKGAMVNIKTVCERPLTAACENGDINIVRTLLSRGAKVNKANGLSYTPLQRACAGGHTMVVEELIKEGANVNLNVPLLDACSEGHLCIVRQLIKMKANVNCERFEKTPLLVACEEGNIDIVKELITAGADVNLKLNEKKTPLIAAIDGGYFNVLKTLLMSGAKIDHKDKATPTFPSFWDHLIVVKRLIEMESSFDINDTNETSIIAECYNGNVKKIIQYEADVNIKDKDKTPLLVACYKANKDLVKELIKMGASVNLGNDFISPLEVACYEGHLNIVKEFKEAFDSNKISNVEKAIIGACFFGHLSVVKELIAWHVEVNLKHEKETPLTTACYMGHLNIVNELIKAGADINLSGGNSTPYTAAFDGNHKGIVFELIKTGINVNQCHGNKTPLTTAYETKSWTVVRELIKAGANVNLSDGNKTPLTAACEMGNWMVVRAMIKDGARVNQSDGNKTPLTTACERGHMKVVHELIKAGANVNKSDGHKTPLTAAYENGNLNVINELEKANADVNQIKIHSKSTDIPQN